MLGARPPHLDHRSADGAARHGFAVDGAAGADPRRHATTHRPADSDDARVLMVVDRKTSATSPIRCLRTNSIKCHHNDATEREPPKQTPHLHGGLAPRVVSACRFRPAARPDKCSNSRCTGDSWRGKAQYGSARTCCSLLPGTARRARRGRGARIPGAAAGSAAAAARARPRRPRCCPRCSWRPPTGPRSCGGEQMSGV